MNKLAIGVAVALVVALLALPGLVGSTTEARVRERIAALDASPSAAAELVAFDRGWFRSTARIVLRPDGLAQLQDTDGDAVPNALPIAIDFAHGPVAVLDGVHFGWSKMIARPDKSAPGVTELEQTLGVPHLFEFRGRTSYFGALAFDADAPPFTLPIDDALLTFSGATLNGAFANSALDASAQAGSIEFASPSGTVAVHGLYASADNELRSAYVMPGAASFAIESISMSEGAQGATPLFEAANLSVKSNVALDAATELLEMRVDYGVDSLRVDENRVTDGALALTVRNLDVAIVEAYGATAAAAANTGDASLLYSAIEPHLERALRAEPSMTFEPIRFRYADEPFDGRIEITTNPSGLPQAGTVSLDNPLLLLGLVNIAADLRLSKALAAELATLSARLQLGADGSIPSDQLDYMAEAQSGLMLTMLVGQGVLAEDGDDYRCSFQFRDGEMTLNGNALPFGLP